RAESEGNDEDQREHDAGNGAGEFQQPPDREAQPRVRRGILRSEEIKGERDDSTDERADIADQNRLAEQLEPFLPAPEPFSKVGPDPRAVVERQDAVEIADEVAEIGE